VRSHAPGSGRIAVAASSPTSAISTASAARGSLMNCGSCSVAVVSRSRRRSTSNRARPGCAAVQAAAIERSGTWPLCRRRAFDGCPLLKVVWLRRTQCQDCRYRTAGPVPAATRWRRAGTLGAASGGLEGSQACPLMLLQQSAQLGVIRSHGKVCVIHTAIIVDREDVRQAMRAGHGRLDSL
jgi:hypothetical protein